MKLQLKCSMLDKQIYCLFLFNLMKHQHIIFKSNYISRSLLHREA